MSKSSSDKPKENAVQLSLGEIEAFIHDMRELGAASVRVGDIAVVFDLPLVAHMAPVAASEKDEKLEEERILYGSSD
jgi:hypothetical protein